MDKSPDVGRATKRWQPERVSAVTLQEEERPLTDAELEMLFPAVPWRDPIMISDFDRNFGFAGGDGGGSAIC